MTSRGGFARIASSTCSGGALEVDLGAQRLGRRLDLDREEQVVDDAENHGRLPAPGLLVQSLQVPVTAYAKP